MELGSRGKTALVTGGSKGIGRAVAYGLAAEGARVAICARDPEALGRAAREIEGKTGQVTLTIAADLSEPASVTRVATEALSGLGRLDILINNAGAIKGGDFLKGFGSEHNFVKQRTFHPNNCLTPRGPISRVRQRS